MQRILPAIHDYQAELVAISPELPDNSLSMTEKNELAFHVLSDQRNNYARKMGLVYTLPEGFKMLFYKWGIDLPVHNGDNTYELPLPATYVVDKAGRIVHSFFDIDHTIRLEPLEILHALKRLAFTIMDGFEGKPSR